MRKADEETLLRSIAANLKRRRAQQKLTQEQLAELVGVDLRIVQRLESGLVNPKATTLAAFSKALKVSVSSLFRRAELVTMGVGRPARKKLRATKTKS